MIPISSIWPCRHKWIKLESKENGVPFVVH